MLVPQLLRAGDLVSVVAPASPARGQCDIRLAIRLFEGAGLSVQMPRRRLYCTTGRPVRVAGPDWVRAAELNAALRDSRVRAVICLRGGYGCMSLLRALDYGAAVADPKPVVGFSDVTALLMALYTRCGLVTYHGPMLTTLAEEVKCGGEPVSAKALFQTLIVGPSTVNLWELSSCAGSGVAIVRPGRASAVLLGGNLSVLCSLLGTPYFPSMEGRLLFLEEVGEPLYRIDRMLTQLELAGVFKSVAGIVLGSFTGSNGNVDSLFRRRFQSVRIPVVSGIMAGHGIHNLTMAIGFPYVLDTEGQSLACASFPP